MPVKSSYPIRKSSRRAQRGDTMIEVLVTIIVIAIGVLGAAGLQVTTLKNLSSSHSSTVAAIVAEDMGERMYANAVIMRDNGQPGLLDTYLHNSKPGGAPDCAAGPCNMTERAQYDMDSFWNQMDALLPSASGQVSKDPGSNTFNIIVRWDEDRSGSTGTNCPPQSASDLECYRLEVTL